MPHIPISLTRRALLAGLLAAPMVSQAGPPKRGLAWNRTGLPLVFPLHVMTLPGHQYYLKLTTEAEGQDAIAAHFDGGGVFRVLAPPGRFLMSVARGQEWRGDTGLFGDETEIVTLDHALEFRVKQPRTRMGWIVDLKDFARPTVSA